MRNGVLNENENSTDFHPNEILNIYIKAHKTAEQLQFNLVHFEIDKQREKAVLEKF